MPRRLATQVLARVLDEDAYSHLALDAALERSDLEARDRGLATEIVYGTLTWLTAIDRILDDAVKGGTRRLDPEVLLILRVSVYQLVFLDRVPAHAILDEAAKLTKRHNRRAVGLVNGVLRTLERSQSAGSITWWSERDREKKPVRYLSQRYAMPTWLTNRLWQMLGLEEAERAAAGFNTRPTTWARDVALRASDTHPLPGALVATERPGEGGEAGEPYAIQDLGSQLIGWLAALSLAAHQGQDVRILDACSGLGGKALHQAALLEAAQVGGAILCVDPQASKLALLAQSASKHLTNNRITLETFEGTLQSFVEQCDEAAGLFDLVLVDAPCTGLGTMRRHPETRWRRSEADVGALAKIQAELLDVAAPLVKPGGVLLYSVCTFTREEGSKQVEQFLERYSDFSRAKPALPEGFDWSPYLDEQGQLTTWPHLHDSDAFFAARLERQR